MADWKKLLKQVLLADGTIDADETALLRQEILADGVVDDEEVDFIVALRNESKETTPEFTEFFFDTLKRNILADGIVDAGEATKIKQILLADGVIDEREKKFLRELKAAAKQSSPEFDALLKESLGA